MNIQESNTLIAKFMAGGDSLHLQKDYITEEYYTLDSDELAFHSSWDWLMPVLDKIKDICFSDEWGETYDSEYFYDIRDCIPDINHTYKAVVQFIELYNKTNS